MHMERKNFILLCKFLLTTTYRYETFYFSDAHHVNTTTNR